MPTSKSTQLDMTRDQVERYLDYCSEMLSLVGKTAALCAEESRDSVILETVSTIEKLTVGLSRKIWQKISNLPPGEPFTAGRARDRGLLADPVEDRERPPPRVGGQLVMIMRTWRGVVRVADADRYADYIRETGFEEYGETPGNRGA